MSSIISCGSTWKLKTEQGDLKLEDLQTEFLQIENNNCSFSVPIEEIQYLSSSTKTLVQRKGVLFQKVKMYWGELPEGVSADSLAKEYLAPIDQSIDAVMAEANVQIPLSDILVFKPWVDEEP